MRIEKEIFFLIRDLHLIFVIIVYFQHRPSEMKAKMNKMKFWKRDTASGEKYRVESTA